MMNNGLKKKLLMPIIIVLVILITSTMGCYERVEMDGIEYNQSTQVVTLKGKAPTKDFIERFLCNKDTLSTTDPSVEFRFYSKANDDYKNSYRTVQKDSVSISGEYAYFSAEIDDLDPDTRYHVRAFGYYFNADPDAWESGWGYSEMMSFKPNQGYDSTATMNIKQDINSKIIRGILDKHPDLKEILINRYLNNISDSD